MRRGLLATRDELVLLRDRIGRKPFDVIYETLRRRCSLILESSPITEGQWQSLHQKGVSGAALNAARMSQGRIIDLLIAHHANPNTAFRDRAIEELKHLAAWSTWVEPGHADAFADVCTAEAAVGAIVGLDWAWEDIGEADRLRMLQAVRHKALEPYRQGVAHKAFWYDCYHHWNAIVNSGCGLAALALGDDEPAAQETYHQAFSALRHFFAALGREGGWDEGTGCWGNALRHVLLFGEANARLLNEQRILHARGMDATGLFPVYFSPNGQSAGFGDSPSLPLYGTFYLLVKHHGLRDLTWWLDTYAFQHDVSAGSWTSAGLALLLRPVDAEVLKVPELAPLKVFHEIGWAAMADLWPRPGLYLAAKTGDLSAHNSRRDMNAIQIQVGGEMLISEPLPGLMRSEPDSPDADPNLVQARLHNTIIVGQRDHAIDAQGTIIEAQSGRNYRWIACDAGEACGGTIHFVRHVVMLVHPQTQNGQMVLILDEVESPTPERVDLFWHCRGPVSGKGMAGEIAGRNTQLHFLFNSSVKTALHVGPQGPGDHPGGAVLTLTAAVTGRAFFLSVFSRQRLGGRSEIKRATSGDLQVTADAVQLHFKSIHRHLQLDRVAGS